jgi:L-threonylcarbamoyladenylate synthase
MKNQIIEAVKCLKKEHIVIYPTDTLYAIGADVFNDITIRTVFKLKKRPLSLALPIAVASYEQMEELAFLSKTARILITEFLPGTLTLVSKKKHVISDLVTGGKSTVALRIPKDQIALKLLKEYGPLTITSANIHNKPVPATINDIKRLFSNEPATMYLDDGPRRGKPSTIVDCSQDPPKILREGTISSDLIYSKVF